MVTEDASINLRHADLKGSKSMSGMAAPKISIIMPNLNGDKYLELSLRSFLAQRYDDKELLVVDARSTDRSHEILEKYVSESPCISWIKRSDSGLSDAINIGIGEASGDLLGYMGSDNILFQGVFDEIARHYKFVEYDAIYFNSYTYWIRDKRIELRRWT